jgi:hypothetical protein
MRDDDIPSKIDTLGRLSLILCHQFVFVSMLFLRQVILCVIYVLFYVLGLGLSKSNSFLSAYIRRLGSYGLGKLKIM